MGCFLGVTDQWARASKSPHAHEVGAARVDPGALSCTGIRGHSIDGRRTRCRPLYDPEKTDAFGGSLLKVPLGQRDSRTRPPENSGMRADTIFSPLASSKSRTRSKYYKLLQRTALIADLVRKAPAGFGQTALMKCLYFLQTVRRVPLGYHFKHRCAVTSVYLSAEATKVYPRADEQRGSRKGAPARIGGMNLAQRGLVVEDMP
jgi:hypothetical protein